MFFAYILNIFFAKNIANIFFFLFLEFGQNMVILSYLLIVGMVFFREYKFSKAFLVSKTNEKQALPII